MLKIIKILIYNNYKIMTTPDENFSTAIVAILEDQNLIKSHENELNLIFL